MIRCHLKSDGLSVTVPCDMAAVYRLTSDHGTLYSISLAASSMEVQAISAALADGSLVMSWDVSDSPLGDHGPAVTRWRGDVRPAPGGFELRKAKLAYDTWHLVAVCKDQKFLLHETDEALWKVLRSDKYTTPMLRSWVPAIREALVHNKLLKGCDFFGRAFDKAQPSYLLLNDTMLDKVVSEGVRKGQMRIAA
jgi:hypothetical protein